MNHLVLAFTVFALASCGTANFRRAYQDAAASPSSAGVEGAWDGHWKSDTNGHKGKLQCVVSAAPKPGFYQFYYAGTYGKLFRFTYKNTERVRARAGAYEVSGERDLGVFGGVFKHGGLIRQDEFNSNYTSERDRGVFRLKRSR